MLLRAGMGVERKSGQGFQLQASAKYPPSRKADRTGDQRAVWAIQTPWNGSEEGNRCSRGWGKPTHSTLAMQGQWELASLINISKWSKDAFQCFQPSSSGCVLAGPGSGLSFLFLVVGFAINLGSEAES